MDKSRPLLWPPNENENPPPFSSSSGKEVTGDKQKPHEGDGEEDTTMKSVWDLDDEEDSNMSDDDVPMEVLGQDEHNAVGPTEAPTEESTEEAKKKKKKPKPLVPVSAPINTGPTLIHILEWLTSGGPNAQDKVSMERDLDRAFLVFDHLTKKRWDQVMDWCYENLHVAHCVHWYAFYMEYRDYKEGRWVGGKKPRVPATPRGRFASMDIGQMSEFEVQILYANTSVLLVAEPFLSNEANALSYQTALVFREVDCCTALERRLRVREKWEMTRHWFSMRVKAAAEGLPPLERSSVQPSANVTNTFWVEQQPMTVYDYFRATAAHRISMIPTHMRTRVGGSRIGPKYELFGELTESFDNLSISNPTSAPPPPSDYGEDAVFWDVNAFINDRDHTIVYEVPWWPEDIAEWSKEDEEIIDVVTCTSPVPAPSEESSAESPFKVPEVPPLRQSVITTAASTVEATGLNGSVIGAVPMNSLFSATFPVVVPPQQSPSPDHVPIDEEPEEEIDVVMVTPCPSPVPTVSHPHEDLSSVPVKTTEESPIPVVPKVIHFAKARNSVTVFFNSIFPPEMNRNPSIICNRRCIEREYAAPLPNAVAVSASLPLPPPHSFDDTVRGRKRAASTSSRNGDESKKSQKKKAKRPRSVHSPLVMDRQPRKAAATAKQVIIQQLCDGMDQGDRGRSPSPSSGSSSASSPACYSSSSASSPCMSPRIDNDDMDLIKEAVAPIPQPTLLSVHSLSTEVLIAPVITVESGLLLSDSPVSPSEITHEGNDAPLVSPLQVNTLTPTSPAVPSPVQPVTPSNSVEYMIKEEVKEEDGSPMDTSPPLSHSPLSSQVSTSPASASAYYLLADEKCPLCDVPIGRYEDRRRHVRKVHDIKWGDCECGAFFCSIHAIDDHLITEKHISVLEQTIRERHGVQRTMTSSSAFTAPTSSTSSDSRPPIRIVIKKGEGAEQLASSLYTSSTPARGASSKKERRKKRGNKQSDRLHQRD